MINFEIYKSGRIIRYKENTQLFKIEKINTLFIFHGLYGRGKNWQSFAKKMSENEKTTVVTVDLRNHGGNIFKENMSYTLMMEDIFDLLNYLEIKKTNLLGHSMGGKLAMLITLLKPNYINKLIIADIAPINYANDNQNIIDALYNLDLNLIKNRNHADELLSKEIDQKFLRAFLLQNIKHVEGDYHWSINLKTIKKSMNDLRSFPKIDQNHKVDTKSLCIYGQNSEYVNVNHFQIFKKYFSNILFHKIKNTGHFLHIENPDEFYEVSKNFFKD